MYTMRMAEKILEKKQKIMFTEFKSSIKHTTQLTRMYSRMYYGSLELGKAREALKDHAERVRLSQVHEENE